MQRSISKTETGQEEGCGGEWANGRLAQCCPSSQFAASAIITRLAFSCSHLAAPNISLLVKFPSVPERFQCYMDSFPYLSISYERSAFQKNMS